MNQYYVEADTRISHGRVHLLKIVNIIFFLLTIAVNFLAEGMPLNRKSTRELSDQYPNLFTPAPLTFSIWSVIYFTLLLFIIWQIWPMRNAERNTRRTSSINALGWKFALLCLLNIGWLFCWHYEFVLGSVVVMLITLGLLIRINTLVFHYLPHTMDNRNFLEIPFGLYLGWISVATVANITAYLVGISWTGFGFSEKLWTEIMLVVAIVLALLAIYSWRNIPYALSVIWALLGIAIQYQTKFDVSVSSIILTAYGGMLILLIAAATQLRKWWDGAANTHVRTSVPTVY